MSDVPGLAVGDMAVFTPQGQAPRPGLVLKIGASKIKLRMAGRVNAIWVSKRHVEKLT